MKLTLEAGELKPGSGRSNLSSRLVFTGERWQSRTPENLLRRLLSSGV